MVSQMTKGFILGFLTCSTMFLLYTVKMVGIPKQQPLDNKESSKTTHPTPRGSQPHISTLGPTLPIYRPRVLCWVMTSPETINTRAVHVKKTWGRRCDLTLFFSTRSDPSFPCIGLNVTEGRRHLWAKTRGAFLHIYEHYLDEFDWFMKADDDTYVIVENLRHFLSKKDPNEPVYYGHQFRDSGDQYSGYNSGGPGYVLSRQALLVFGTNITRFKQFCPKDGPDEDLRMGMCLRRLGVKTVNAEDEDRLIKTFCFEIELHLKGEYPTWYKARGVHANQMGIGNFSRNAISFHYVKPWIMYLFDYFVYRFSLKTEYGDSGNYILNQNNWLQRSATTRLTNTLHVTVK